MLQKHYKYLSLESMYCMSTGFAADSSVLLVKLRGLGNSSFLPWKMLHASDPKDMGMADATACPAAALMPCAATWLPHSSCSGADVTCKSIGDWYKCNTDMQHTDLYAARSLGSITSAYVARASGLWLCIGSCSDIKVYSVLHLRVCCAVVGGHCAISQRGC